MQIVDIQKSTKTELLDWYILTSLEAAQAHAVVGRRDVLHISDTQLPVLGILDAHLRTRAHYSSADHPPPAQHSSNTRYPHSNFTAYVVAFLHIANFTNVAITAVLFKYLQSLSSGCIDK